MSEDRAAVLETTEELFDEVGLMHESGWPSALSIWSSQFETMCGFGGAIDPLEWFDEPDSDFSPLLDARPEL